MYKVVHSTMIEVDLYISAYSCLMADQTWTSQYVEVVLAWLWQLRSLVAADAKIHIHQHLTCMFDALPR